MTTDVHPDSTSVGSLVSGIIDDAQELIQQHLALFKHEMTEDFRKTWQSSLWLMVGLTVGGIGVLLLGFMLAELAASGLAIPVWGGLAIVGGVFAAAGLVVLVLAALRLAKNNPLPDQTAEALKENLQWLTRPK